MEGEESNAVYIYIQNRSKAPVEKKTFCLLCSSHRPLRYFYRLLSSTVDKNKAVADDKSKTKHLDGDQGHKPMIERDGKR